MHVKGVAQSAEDQSLTYLDHGAEVIDMVRTPEDEIGSPAIPFRMIFSDYIKQARTKIIFGLRRPFPKAASPPMRLLHKVDRPFER